MIVSDLAIKTIITFSIPCYHWVICIVFSIVSMVLSVTSMIIILGFGYTRSLLFVFPNFYRFRFLIFFSETYRILTLRVN